jgi:hypothetical protein
MQRWEYAQMTIKGDKALIIGTDDVQTGKRPFLDVLNELGNLGWEAVSMATTPLEQHFVLLKRPKQ